MEKSDDDNIIGAIGCLVAVNCRKTRVKKRKRSVRVKIWLSKRAQVNLLTEPW